MSIARIDPTICNGCGICVTTCPVDVIRLDTVVADKVTYPACRAACPAGVDMRRYIYLLRIGMIDEAVKVLRETLPLPAVTGRVCPHPCETECTRGEMDTAVNINALERFVADYWLEEKASPVRQIYSARIAVVGSGPAGLACAYFLAQMGYPVTVFEAMTVLGGMLRVGIPEYRLPGGVLNSQINYIRDMGVEFRTGVSVGRDIILDQLRQEYQSVFLAIGNQLSTRINLEGTELNGVLWGLDFLRDVRLDQAKTIEGRVAVIGGGNVAIDAARTALRLGAAKVDIYYRRTRKEMPAYKGEINQAIDEGVGLHELQELKRITGENGKVTGLELIHNQQEAQTIAVDTIILAIGQTADSSSLPGNIDTDADSAVLIDPITLQTSQAGVFAGGDITVGRSSVVEAVADGHRAAISIDHYIKGENLKSGRYAQANRVLKPPKTGITSIARKSTPTLSVDQRAGNFQEVAQCFDEDTARMESSRCLTCGSRAVISYVDDCMMCLYCELDCPVNAIYVSPEKTESPILAWG